MPYGTAMKDPGGYLKEESIQNIISSAKTERDRLMILTLATTGRRVSEVVGPWGIRKTDIDPENSRIAFTILKKPGTQDDKPRKWKHVPKSLAESLALFSSNTPPSEPIFALSRQHAFKIIRRTAQDAGVTTVSGKKVHPHHFRHSWVARRIEKGISLEEAFMMKDYLEHSNISITQSYAHINPDNEKKLFDEGDAG